MATKRVNISINDQLHSAAGVHLKERGHEDFSNYVEFLICRDMGMPLPGDGSLEERLSDFLKASAPERVTRPKATKRPKNA